MTPARATELIALVAVCVVSSLACASSQNAPVAAKQEGGDGIGQCSATRPPKEPDLMAWDPAARADLNRLRHEGVVAVRYEAKGCDVELEVLPNCVGDGSYTYSAYAARDSRTVHDSRELYAMLPVGAARVGGKLRGGRVLRTDWVLAGVDSLPPGKTLTVEDLKGSARECHRATHVVSTIFVGGFELVAGERRSIEGSARIFSAAAGGGSSEETERLAREGDPEACAQAQASGREAPLCSVPLRVALTPLQQRSAERAEDEARRDRTYWVTSWLEDERKRFATTGLKGGLLALGFSGETMFTVPSCAPSGRYTFAPFRRQHDFSMRTEAERFEQFGAGAFALPNRNELLRMKATTFGEWRVERLPTREGLANECAKTAPVSKIAVGTFELTTASGNVVARGGDLIACEKGAPPADCAVPLYIEVSSFAL